jgi:crotonobetainyl-CoA:carnitine CoA-transferase CaiB-like acyl-CoA transferase
VIVELTGPEGQTRHSLSAVWQFPAGEAGLTRWPPTLGQDNNYVFGELLGLTDVDIAGLQGEGVLA